MAYDDFLNNRVIIKNMATDSLYNEVLYELPDHAGDALVLKSIKLQRIN